MAGDVQSGVSARERFLAAASCQPVDCTPVWFMRQAGRCLAEYRALREKYDILTMTRTPDLCSQVTLMPVETFGVDAAVMYADIMLPLYALELAFSIDPGIGPIVPEPVRTMADVGRLAGTDPRQAVSFLYEAMRMVRSSLGDSTALVGFAGGPFTIASYMVEGKPSREFPFAKGLIYREPAVWHALMERVTAVTIPYLEGQIEAGADAIQLFDSWAGSLSAQTYEKHVLPYTGRIVDAVRGHHVPVIHFSTGSTHLTGLVASTGVEVISVDWREKLSTVASGLSRPVCLQGNLDPAVVLGTHSFIEEEARRVLDDARELPGHIFNLGHGVLAETPSENLAFLARRVHELSARVPA